MAAFLKKPQVKSVTLGLLTLIIGALCSSFGSWIPSEVPHFFFRVLFLVILSILYVGLLIFYGSNEINNRRAAEENSKQIAALEKFASNIMSICNDNATKVNRCIRKMKKHGTIDLDLWNFNSACMDACKIIYDHICSCCGSNDIAVAYIRLAEDKPLASEVYMNGYANRNNSPPSIFMARRRIDIDEAKNYHDVDLFRQNKADIDIMIGSDTINDAFSYMSKESRSKNKGKYSQYVGIPVFCDNQKMVGLVEVVGYHDAKLGLNEQEIKELASKFLVPYSYLFCCCTNSKRR